jgi:hypothetical protein
MVHDSASAPVLTGDPTTDSPRGWFAGAGDNRDHAIRAWTPDESGYLNTVCGRPSAQAGRTTNQPCPACQAAARAPLGLFARELNLIEPVENNAVADPIARDLTA